MNVLLHDEDICWHSFQHHSARLQKWGWHVVVTQPGLVGANLNVWLIRQELAALAGTERPHLTTILELDPSNSTPQGGGEGNMAPSGMGTEMEVCGSDGDLKLEGAMGDVAMEAEPQSTLSSESILEAKGKNTEALLQYPDYDDDMDMMTKTKYAEKWRVIMTAKALERKLLSRRPRDVLVNQGIMPPLKSPIAFHEQMKSLERAKTGDLLQRKIRLRPDRQELIQQHILQDTNIAPSLQANQNKLKRARLADDLNDKLAQRPGPLELVEKNVLGDSAVQAALKGCVLQQNHEEGGQQNHDLWFEEDLEYKKPELLDEDSGDSMSPPQLDQPMSQQSQSSQGSMNESSSPTAQTVISYKPDQMPVATSAVMASYPLPTTGDGLMVNVTSPLSAASLKTSTSTTQAIGKGGKQVSASPRPSKKKQKEKPPKPKKLKYHQYIPPTRRTPSHRRSRPWTPATRSSCSSSSSSSSCRWVVMATGSAAALRAAAHTDVWGHDQHFWAEHQQTQDAEDSNPSQPLEFHFVSLDTSDPFGLSLFRPVPDKSAWWRFSQLSPVMSQYGQQYQPIQPAPAKT
ncbi:hypothetical protein Bbelb_430880, partial [Branchiostoma belcheri]